MTIETIATKFLAAAKASVEEIEPALAGSPPLVERVPASTRCSIHLSRRPINQ